MKINCNTKVLKFEWFYTGTMSHKMLMSFYFYFRTLPTVWYFCYIFYYYADFSLLFFWSIPRILRLCKTCNKIEDEDHFILECTINSQLRTDLFEILANENPNFMQFSSVQKLIYLLNPTTTAHVKIIGFYIIKSLEPRTEVS